ncbi:hypothetical protein A6D94_19625 [Vibrio splendidus]|nr:hypothetical protein A6D94_19625 [Vibrio splendidus]
MDRQSAGSPAAPLLTDYIKKPKPQSKDWGFLRLEFRWFGFRELRLESPARRFVKPQEALPCRISLYLPQERLQSKGWVF